MQCSSSLFSTDDSLSGRRFQIFLDRVFSSLVALNRTDKQIGRHHISILCAEKSIFRCLGFTRNATSPRNRYSHPNAVVSINSPEEIISHRKQLQRFLVFFNNFLVIFLIHWIDYMIPNFSDSAVVLINFHSVDYILDFNWMRVVVCKTAITAVAPCVKSC